MCSEGVADADRATELVEAAALGDGAVLRVLEQVTDRRAFEVVVGAVAHPDPRVRVAALRALAGVGDERGDELVACLEDGDPFIRRMTKAVPPRWARRPPTPSRLGWTTCLTA